MSKVIGLTGGPQSGKSELADVIGSISGVRYVDMFQEITHLKARDILDGGPYKELIGKYLKNDGNQKLSYYLAMCLDPELNAKVKELDLEHARGILEELRGQNSQDVIVVSWVHWMALMGQNIEPDEMIYLGCEDKDAWLHKLQTRIRSRFKAFWIPNRLIETTFTSLGFHPDQVKARIQKLVPETKLQLVDTTPDDWAEAEVVSAVRSAATRLVGSV